MTATTVKVKPLEWPTESRHNGIYRTKHNGTGIYYMMRVHAPNRVSWRCSEVFGWNEAETAFAAKAAAQADYEARILSAIDTTDLDAHMGAVLEEAAKEAENIGGIPRRMEHHDPSYTQGHETAGIGIAGVILALRPDALTALDRAKHEARVEGMRMAARACDWGDIYGDNAVRAIRALIEAERGKP